MLVNRFTRLFLALSDGTGHILDVAARTLNKLADSHDDFCSKTENEDEANQ